MSMLDKLFSYFRRSRDVVTFTTVTRSHEGFLVHTKITGEPVYNSHRQIVQRKVTVEHTRLNVGVRKKYNTTMEEEAFQQLRFQVAK